MLDIFGQVHWRTLQNFDDKKAPESSDAGAFFFAYLFGCWLWCWLWQLGFCLCANFLR
jgi:hypothetical protein